MNYSRFFAMIATSTVVMFGLMYLNTYVVDHVFWSETRVYMAVVMGATMAFIMLAFMLSMYASRGLNIAIFAGSIAVFAVALWLVRSQTSVEDRSYMSAMIPHHSIAIMTSTRANISDPRVRKLADGIIYAQDKEIAEMRYLIADIAANGDASDDKAESAARLADAREALSTEVLATIDPEFLKEEEIAEVFPEGAACRYAYAEKSPPVFVVGDTTDGLVGLVKISGDLVQLPTEDATRQGGTFEAEPLVAELRESGDGDLYDLIVTAGAEYEAGFRGHYACTAS